MQNRSEWLNSRRQHLKQIRNMVEARLPNDSEEVLSYTQSFLRSFGSNWSISSRKQMIAELEHSRVIMISDFHAHSQSQRVIRRFVDALPKSWDLVLAVEFLESQHQSSIDQYMASEISAAEFRRQVEWDQRWGFNFKSYNDILLMAKKKKIKVIGINSYEEVETENSMQRRDQFAARKVASILKERPRAKVLVVFGELHLAKDRLPRQIYVECGVKFPESSVVYQNPERIYLKLLEQGREADVVRIGAGRFAIMGSPPWVQWQSYLLYLERKYDDDFEEDDEDLYDDGGSEESEFLDEEIGWGDEESSDIDVDSLVVKYIRLLAHDLEVEIDGEKIEVYSSFDDLLWNKVKAKMSPQRFKYVKALMIANESLYFPGTGWGYLSQISVNHATTIAGHFVHSEIAGITRLPWRLPSDFERLIWYNAVSFFLSKWINPHRKADTLNDLQIALHDSRGNAQEALLLALDQKMSEILKIRDFSRNRKIVPRRKLSYFRAARILGGMMGEKLYYGFKAGRLAELKSWISQPLYQDSFTSLYEEIVTELEKINMPYSSKRERF